MSPTSTAINNANTAVAPFEDYYSNERGSAPDLGAVEYRQSCITMVTNNLNSGEGSLRDAMNCAQEGDTIRFYEVQVSEIALTSPITIDKHITWHGWSGAIQPSIRLNTMDNVNLIVNPAKSFDVSNILFKDVANFSGVPHILNYGYMYVKNTTTVSIE